MNQDSGAGAEIDSFMQRLLRRFPDHAADYSDALSEAAASAKEYAWVSQGGGPVRFLSDVGATLLADARSSGTRAAEARQVLVTWVDFLAAEFGRDPGVDSLIEDGFLQQFYQRAADGWDPVDLLPAPLRAKVDADRGWREEPTVQAFVNRLVAAVPAEFARAAEENRHGDFGDVLSYGFMADVGFGLMDDVAAGVTDAMSRARTVFAALETEYGHDGRVDMVILAGGIENLPYPDEPAQQIIDALGPRLRAEFDRQHQD